MKLNNINEKNIRGHVCLYLYRYINYVYKSLLFYTFVLERLMQISECILKN